MNSSAGTNTSADTGTSAREAPDAPSRGQVWFTALTGRDAEEAARPGVPSVLVADTELGGRPARVLATRPDRRNPRPRARDGELGLDEGWTLAAAVREAVDADADAKADDTKAGDVTGVDAQNGVKRTIVAVVDAPSQAYGYQEELLGIHQALAAAVDAYSAARLAGHPVVAFVVGKAISGAFLAHGLQANRIVVLDDDGIQVQAMSKESAARVTKRTVAELDEIAEKVPATAYDGATFATLGAVHRVLRLNSAGSAAEPVGSDVEAARSALSEAAADALDDPRDLSVRMASEAAKERRAASAEVRRRLAATWHAKPTDT